MFKTVLDYENTVYITATSRRLGTRGHIYLNKFPLAEKQTKKDKFEFPRAVDEEVQGGKKKFIGSLKRGISILACNVALSLSSSPMHDTMV